MFQNTHFQTSKFPSTTSRTNLHINATYTQHFTSTASVSNISSNVSNVPTHRTVPLSKIPESTSSHSTYINSSTSISEPNKLFDGLGHNFTPEEFLQHTEARVTFLLGLKPMSDHECKFWHARRRAFIQCSLTGTALSWHIRLNDTYKQAWHAFVQAFKKQCSSHKNAYYA